MKLSTAGLAAPESFVEGPRYDVWRELRERGPVWTPADPRRHGFWSICRYDDAVAVLADVATFSAENGMTVDTAGPRRDPAAGLMLELTDDGHSELLRAVLTAIRTVTEDGGRDRLAQRATAVAVDEAASWQRHGDGVRIAQRAGVGMVELMLGLSTGRAEALLVAVRKALHEPARPATRWHALRLLDHASAEAGGGSCRLAAALRDGLSNFEPELARRAVVANLFNIIAGVVSVQDAIASGLAALADRRLKTPVTTALVADLLRVSSNTLHVTRVAKRDTVIAGAEIGSGDVVAVWLVAANHDEAVFPRSDEILDRSGRSPILAFGAGTHRCIMRAFAQVVLRHVLGAIATDFVLAPGSAPRRYVASNFLSSLDTLPLVVRPRR